MEFKHYWLRKDQQEKPDTFKIIKRKGGNDSMMYVMEKIFDSIFFDYLFWKLNAGGTP
jgi:ATP/ADP translocase